MTELRHNNRLNDDQYKSNSSADSGNGERADSATSANSTVSQPNSPTIVPLSDAQVAGHGDHWSILTDYIENDVPEWLQRSIDSAGLPEGLGSDPNLSATHASHLLLADKELCHINQVLAMKNGKPVGFVNAYPCVNSPYGVNCHIERIIASDECQDAVLCLLSEDGTRIYAFDQLYTINKTHYKKDTEYFVNLSAWAYNIQASLQDEVIRVEDPEAIRYHRAFNDIVATNGGIPPKDIEELIKSWQPADAKDFNRQGTDSKDTVLNDTVSNIDVTTSEQGQNIELAPVEINLGHMCAYLFGETLGQEDEAWCQGQVLGKQQTTFFEQDITVLDVAILREPNAAPCVVRMATPSSKLDASIEVNDYIQANIWLQAAIYKENQND